nr:MAG TPA: hypothetical protein [Caudoviricetes sp.]
MNYWYINFILIFIISNTIKSYICNISNSILIKYVHFNRLLLYYSVTTSEEPSTA